MNTFVKRTASQGHPSRVSEAWPDVSAGLAEVDDDAFIRAIEAGRRRELAPSL